MLFTCDIIRDFFWIIMEKKLRTVLFTKYLLLWYDKRKADRERSGIMEQLALSRAENLSADRKSVV